MKKIFAKKLRQNSSDVENILWYHLRGRRFLGYKFRRQEPIGKYIVDFVCIEKKLIIELDGGQHGERKQIEHDKVRTMYLERLGFSVMRFWNNELLSNLEDVLEEIQLSLTRRHDYPIKTTGSA